MLSAVTSSTAGNHRLRASDSVGDAYSLIVSLSVGDGIDLVVTPQAIERPFGWTRRSSGPIV